MFYAATFFDVNFIHKIHLCVNLYVLLDVLDILDKIYLDEIFGSLTCDVALLGTCFPTFRDNRVVLSSTVEKSKAE